MIERKKPHDKDRERPPVPAPLPFPMSNSADSGASGRMPSANPPPKPCSTAASRLDDQAIDVSEPSPGVVIPIQPWGGTTQMFWDSDLGQVDRDDRLFALPPPQSGTRGACRPDHRHVREAADQDGYLNAWFQRVQPDRRWTNLRDHTSSIAPAI